MEPTDAALVQSTLRGETRAYNQLVTRYQRQVYNLAFRMVGNGDDACDLVQDTFIRAFSALASFRQDASFLTWLYKICSNLSIDLLRSRRAKSAVSLQDELEDGREPAADERESSPEDTVVRGAIGDIVALQTTRNLGYLWQRPRQPEWTEMEFQMRNWYYFGWLSGDHNVEQQIHGIDKCAWAMKDKTPLKAWAVSGRQVRVEPNWGDIYDHHAVVYEYDNGTRMYALARQQPGCFNDYSEVLLGTKGRCDLQKGRIEGETNWVHGQQAGDLSAYSSRKPREGALRPMHQVEQDELFAAIRAGKTINNGEYMCQSTLMAILGRTAGYTGQLLTWEQMKESKQDLSPQRYTFDATPPTVPGVDGKYPVAMPGVTKFV